MTQLITFGETMGVFVPLSDGPLRYARAFHPYAAGSESNVAIGCAKLGVKTEWISRLGDDEIGHFVCGRLLSEGVGCRQVIFDEEHPTGIMFKEVTADKTKVFYYRLGSAASHMTAYDLEKAVGGLQKTPPGSTRMLYLTGITPVLSKSCEQMTRRAFAIAEDENMTVAFDPNIRRKLWKKEEHAPLLKDCMLKSQIVLTGLDEAEELLGCIGVPEILDCLFEKGRARYAAVKDGANGAVVSDGSQTITLSPYPCKCVETTGAGDGFNAGFLTGLIRKAGLETAGRMGSICGAMATQVSGDYEGYPTSGQMRQMLAGMDEIIR